MIEELLLNKGYVGTLEEFNEINDIAQSHEMIYEKDNSKYIVTRFDDYNESDGSASMYGYENAEEVDKIKGTWRDK